MPLYAGAAAVVGGAAIGASSARSQASKSIKFQREMARKAHQYEVIDLRKAGLNPILSGTGGPGAKASGGAMAPVPDFASTALQALKVKAEIDNIEANTSLTLTKEGAERPGGEFGRDIDAIYKKAKGAASAIDVKKNWAESQSRMGKPNPKMKKIYKKAKRKGNIKRIKAGDKWYDF